MDLKKTSFHILNKITDIFLICISCSINILLFRPNVGIYEYIILLIILIVAWIISSNITGLYDDFRTRSFIYEIKATVNNGSIQLLTLVILIFFTKEQSVSRLLVVLYPSCLVVMVLIKRFFIKIFLQYWRAKGHNIRRLLIIGMGEIGVNFYYTIKNTPELGYSVVGFLDDGDKDFQNEEYLGTCENLEKLLENRQIDDVIICLPNYATEKIEKIIRVCENHTTRVKIIPDFFRYTSGKSEVSLFGKFPIISLRATRISQPYWRSLKRLFDFSFTILMFVFIFWWLWILIALVIKISSPGPVFYKQDRWGINNKRFTAWKFRSMCIDAGIVDLNGKYKQAQKNDSRVTKVGRILRKTNLDELPQFINILFGSMSLVGPRPHPIPLNIESKKNIEHYMLRHLVKPGLTGWAQIHGYRGSTKDPALMQKRIDHDIWYIENWSFLLDLQIIFLTVWNMIRGDKNAY